MCPEKELLSVYLDGELPSPWKERMEAHLASCPDCALSLKKFAACAELLHQPLPGIEAAQDRVWRNISARCGVAERPRRKLWKRTVSLPLPSAVAAAAAFVFVFIFAVARVIPSAAPAGEPVMASSNPMDIEMRNIEPVSDMGNVLRYLQEQESADYMIIRLPESREFSASGGPAILKAVDYSGRTDSR
jgi:hypothetical protein